MTFRFLSEAMTRVTATAAGALIAAGVSMSSAWAATELTVYTAIESDDLKRYAAAFERDNPDIKVKWVRDSTGIIAARLRAEKKNPQADVVWGLAATSLMILKAEGMTVPYTPKGVEKLDPRFVDSAKPPHWVGMDAWAAVICFNTVEAGKKGLPVPKTWRDLTNPVYKGAIVMPNPASSGTGFLQVTSWLQLFGDGGGWQYMDDLHKNVSWYTHSGSKPCRQAGAGEAPIGISFEFRGAREKAGGAPLELVVPTEGIGWDMEASTIIKGTKKLEAAKKLIDWSISEKAMNEYNQGYAVVAITALAKPVPHIPPNILQAMIKNDFDWAAKNQDAILAEWKKRFDGKSEKK